MEVHIDLSYLENMSGGDKELMQEMIDIFKEQVPEFVSEMKSNLQKSDYKNLGSIAHKAKSSISIIGLVQLIDDLKVFEKNVNEGKNTETYQTFIENFERTCNQAIKQLNSLSL